MRKLLTTVLAAGLLLIAAPAANAYENHYTDRQRHACQFRRNDRWNDAEVRDTIRCVGRAFGVNVSTMLRIASCESHFKAYASNDGNYLGVFQQSARYWPTRQDHADKDNRWNIRESAFNARSNTIVSARMMRGGGFGAWACY